MALIEKYYAVLIYGRRIGTLCQKGDFTRFTFNEKYLSDSNRPVLGLRFEEALRRPYSSALRLPRWFSNLLPEGPLREWIAADRGVSLEREMELLAQVGHDLPGAVQVLPADSPDEDWEWPDEDSALAGAEEVSASASPWRFSLAGVALKFSMLARADRLTVPAVGEYGDWLVKFPDYRYSDVPRNEFTMMSMARDVGIDVPEVRLVHRDELDNLPSRMWPGSEEWAYAIRRFDRLSGESRVHIEDFAQVRDKYPEGKYEGTFETVAALAYRGYDLEALRETVRRLAFSVTIGNGDAHLKNWSLIYLDRRIPTLSPAYDLVSTTPYSEFQGDREDIGLKFCGSRRFSSITLSSFDSLESRIDHRFGKSGAHLSEVALEVCKRTLSAWEARREALAQNPSLAANIADWMLNHRLY
ncbi:type II toxin-antitoxin system HipA family toxin [Nonomuraea fuscirosea]|uniref:type II toxin-antitoxin system HipA family toxin n=1 Tax=Nonomuraea fuscirosea TaxID=1291556 RepID=UPI0034319EBF